MQWIFKLSVTSFQLFLIASFRFCRFANGSRISLRTPNPAGYPKCSNLMENMMPIHQQLWSLECSIVETVASLLHGVMEHCVAGVQNHCPDKVDDIQAIRKSSTDRCNSSDQLLFSADQWKRHQFFHSKKLQCYRQLFWESGSWIVQPLWWNVTFWSIDFRSVFSSSSISQWRLEWRRWCDN